MHSARTRRAGILVLVLFALALPAAAQPDREPGANLGWIVASLWHRLSAPVVSLWEKGRSDIDPNGVTTATSATPPDTTDGRTHIDPNG